MSARVPMEGKIKTIMRMTDDKIRLELELTGPWGPGTRPAVIMLDPNALGVIGDYVADVLHDRSETARLAELDQTPYEGDGFGVNVA